MTRTFTRRTVWAGVAVTAAAAGVAASILVIAPAANAAPAPAADIMTTGLQDKSTGAYLRVQLDSTKSAYGAFVLALPGVGLAWPTTTATVTQDSTDSIELSYDSAGQLQPQAQLDTEFGVAYQAAEPTKKAKLRLAAQIDPAHHTGSVDVWLNRKHYHLDAGAAPETADTTVNAFLTAMRAGQWAAVYQLTDDAFHSAASKDQFTQAMDNRLGTHGLTAASTTAPTTYTTTTTGIRYASAPVSITTTTGGVNSTQAGTLKLIFNNGQWRIFTLDLPS